MEKDRWESNKQFQVGMMHWAYLSGNYQWLGAFKNRKLVSEWLDLGKLNDLQRKSMKNLFIQIAKRNTGRICPEWEKIFY